MAKWRLSPTQALWTIRAALSDTTTTQARRNVIAMVLCHANSKTGEAWASYRGLHDEMGAGYSTISGALADGDGRYFRKVRKGPSGAHCYRIIPAPMGKQSAIEAEALEGPQALPSGGAALPPRKSALPPKPNSATEAVAKLALHTSGKTSAARRQPASSSRPARAGAETSASPTLATPPAPDGAAALASASAEARGSLGGQEKDRQPQDAGWGREDSEPAVPLYEATLACLNIEPGSTDAAVVQRYLDHYGDAVCWAALDTLRNRLTRTPKTWRKIVTGEGARRGLAEPGEHSMAVIGGTTLLAGVLKDGRAVVQSEEDFERNRAEQLKNLRKHTAGDSHKDTKLKGKRKRQ